MTRHRHGPPRRAPATDAASVSVELALLVPVFALVLALVILVGRTQATRADVEAAAHGAARTITLSRDRATAVDTARVAAAERLDVGSRSCRTMDWSTVLSEDRVEVTLSCEVDLSEVTVLAVPGSFTVSATATEPVDIYMEAPSR